MRHGLRRASRWRSKWNDALGWENAGRRFSDTGQQDRIGAFSAYGRILRFFLRDSVAASEGENPVSDLCPNHFLCPALGISQ
jgi:hypothetical protein